VVLLGQVVGVHRHLHARQRRRHGIEFVADRDIQQPHAVDLAAAVAVVDGARPDVAR
jgi:hypothetical protein